MGLIRKLAEKAIPLALAAARDPFGELSRMRLAAKDRLSRAELLALLALRAAVNHRLKALSREEEDKPAPSAKYEDLEIE